jgi:AraC family transcriptional regulator
MDISLIIADVVQYIEDNIRAKLSLEEISQAVFLSKYHLHRIFTSVAKIPLMEYVRNRKLSLSIEELLHTKMRIIDIAYLYAFDYEQSYIRSFKKLFNLSPTELRINKKGPVKIVDKLNLNLIKAVEKGIVFEHSTVIIPKIYVVGIKHTVFQDDNLKNATANKLAVDFFYNHRHKIENAKNPNQLISLSRYGDILANKSIYLPCLEVADLENIPAGMNGDTIPANKYVVFNYIGLHPPKDVTIIALSNIYAQIDKWFPESGMRFADNYHFEKIDTTISTDEYCEVQVYLTYK